MKRVGVKDLLEIASAIERSGQDIFLDLRERHASDRRLADIFGRLAEEERHHLAKIQDYEKRFSRHSLLLGDLYQIGVVKEYFRDFSYRALMRDYVRLTRKGKNIRHPYQAVRLAIDLELDSILFYERFREINRDIPEVDALLRELLRFEVSHLEILVNYMRSTVEA